MRYALALTAAALLAPASAFAADPPITFQTHPFERVLGDLRAAADLIGGEQAVKGFNDSIKEKFGPKGFEGLDLSKPIVGYVTLDPKPENITAVIAFPVTGEKEFLALCDRANGEKYKDLGKGLYQLPPLDPQYKARMRFAAGHAYIAYGANPEPALEAKALVAPEKLYDPSERGTIAGRFHFDRVPPEVKKSALTMLADLRKKLASEIDPSAPNQAAVKAAFAEIEKLTARYLILLEQGADTATVRVGLDPATADVFVDATLTPKPGTQLAKEIAARKPAENHFAGLFTPDTVAGFRYSAPLFAPEVRNALAAFSGEQQKDLMNTLPEAAKATVEELMKGQARTMKSGEFDFALVVRGPDKNGLYTAVGAMSFDDPSGLEKAFKKYMEADGPPEGVGAFKWDADKAGKVGIHTFKFNGGNVPPPVKMFGEDTTLAFAFAPKGIYVAFGPDPIAAVKDALKAKPAESAALDVLVNPARLAKMVEKGGGNPLAVERAIGKEDKLLSAGSLRVISGKELTVRFAVNLKIGPRAIFESTVRRD
ncbi:MAG: hypothetical protein J0I06_00570 [Planctomycetes bacterium]|nr:hypothetical protein [Planctomycetota bacterium]